MRKKILFIVLSFFSVYASADSIKYFKKIKDINIDKVNSILILNENHLYPEIQKNDRVVAINGIRVFNSEEFNYIKLTKPKEEIELTIIRNNETIDLKITSPQKFFLHIFNYENTHSFRNIKINLNALKIDINDSIKKLFDKDWELKEKNLSESLIKKLNGQLINSLAEIEDTNLVENIIQAYLNLKFQNFSAAKEILDVLKSKEYADPVIEEYVKFLSNVSDDPYIDPSVNPMTKYNIDLDYLMFCYPWPILEPTWNPSEVGGTDLCKGFYTSYLEETLLPNNFLILARNQQNNGIRDQNTLDFQINAYISNLLLSFNQYGWRFSWRYNNFNNYEEDLFEKSNKEAEATGKSDLRFSLMNLIRTIKKKQHQNAEEILKPFIETKNLFNLFIINYFIRSDASRFLKETYFKGHYDALQSSLPKIYIWLQNNNISYKLWLEDNCGLQVTNNSIITNDAFICANKILLAIGQSKNSDDLKNKDNQQLVYTTMIVGNSSTTDTLYNKMFFKECAKNASEYFQFYIEATDLYDLYKLELATSYMTLIDINTYKTHPVEKNQEKKDLPQYGSTTLLNLLLRHEQLVSADNSNEIKDLLFKIDHFQSIFLHFSEYSKTMIYRNNFSKNVDPFLKFILTSYVAVKGSESLLIRKDANQNLDNFLNDKLSNTSIAMILNSRLNNIGDSPKSFLKSVMAYSPQSEIVLYKNEIYRFDYLLISKYLSEFLENKTVTFADIEELFNVQNFKNIYLNILNDQTPSDSSNIADIASIIKDLGNQNYQIRKNATELLLNANQNIKETLKELKDQYIENLEIYERIEYIIKSSEKSKTIAKEIIKNEFNKLLLTEDLNEIKEFLKINRASLDDEQIERSEILIYNCEKKYSELKTYLTNKMLMETKPERLKIYFNTLIKNKEYDEAILFFDKKNIFRLPDNNDAYTQYRSLLTLFLASKFSTKPNNFDQQFSEYNEDHLKVKSSSPTFYLNIDLFKSALSLPYKEFKEKILNDKEIPSFQGMYAFIPIALKNKEYKEAKKICDERLIDSTQETIFNLYEWRVDYLSTIELKLLQIIVYKLNAENETALTISKNLKIALTALNSANRFLLEYFSNEISFKTYLEKIKTLKLKEENNGQILYAIAHEYYLGNRKDAINCLKNIDISQVSLQYSCWPIKQMIENK